MSADEPSNAVLLEKINNLGKLLVIIDQKVDGKASGWVETVTKGAIGITLTAVMMAILALVIITGTGALAYIAFTEYVSGNINIT